MVRVRHDLWRAISRRAGRKPLPYGRGSAALPNREGQGAAPPEPRADAWVTEPRASASGATRTPPVIIEVNPSVKEFLQIRGPRLHNLKDGSVSIPHN